MIRPKISSNSVDDYYSWSFSEDEELNCWYQFITKHHVRYFVWFKVDEYSEYLEDFPNLLEFNYSFGFNKIKISEKDRNQSDPLIKTTIYKILLDFFKIKDDQVILLYHCDKKDKRQKYRNKLFSDWEGFHADNSPFVRQTVTVEIDREDGKEENFIGLIIPAKSLKLNVVLQEFEGFADYLIHPKD